MPKLITYLDACFFSAKTLDFMKESIKNAEISIKKSKYLSKLAIQFAVQLYLLKEFKKAAKIINYAYIYSCKALKDTLASCRRLQIQYSNRPKSPNYSKSKINKILLVERGLPTLESVNQFISIGIIRKTQMRTALGIKTYPEWVQSFSMDSIIKIVPTKSTEFNSLIGIQSEFTKDSILYKTALLSTSMLYLGLISKECGEKKEGKRFCKLSYTLISCFFPKSSPISKKVACEYQADNNTKEQQNEEKAAPKNKRNHSISVPKRNLKDKDKDKENNQSKLKAAYDRPSSELKRLLSKKNIKRNKSDVNSIFKNIHNSISFTEQRSDYD